MNKVIWLTGLPSSGKTTIAKELNKYINGIILDGDEIRGSYISKGLGFSKKDRDLNLYRVAEIAKICSVKTNVICSFVSPYNSTRQEIKDIIGEDKFIEVFVDCSVEECIKRDVKGLYLRALDGLIDNFTGISDPYESPANPDLILDTHNNTVDECVFSILDYIGYYDNVYEMYIGRWNGVFHNGHDYIINQKLMEGKSVMLAVRDIKPDDNNPFTAYETKEMLDYYYRNNDNVKVIVIPDINSVNYGRGVGYDINEIKVDREIAGISGTKCRELLKNDNIEEIRKFVPSDIVDFLLKKRG
jgi:adenylylsulfate kinase